MYVVFGVTGNTGKVVADSLLAQKKPVRVVVRDAAKGEPWKARGAEVAVATVSDAKALENALRGADGAYILLPPDYATNKVLEDKKKEVAAFAAAIPASGVKHVVLLSSYGAHQPDGTGPIRWLHPAEKVFADLGTPFTFLRASFFMENWATSLGPVKETGTLYAMFKKKLPMIATKDIGTTAATLLLEGASKTSVVNLRGPAEHDPADVAKTLGRILGKQVNVVFVPEEGRIPALVAAGMTPDMANLYRELTVGVDSGKVAFEAGGRNLKGTTPLESVLRELMEPSKNMNHHSSDPTLSEAEIIGIAQAYYDGVDSRDPDRLAGLYSSAPSTSLAFNADPPIVGRAAIRDFCAQFFQAVTVKHTRIEVWTRALMGEVVPREMPLGQSAATITVVSTALPTFTIDNAAGATKLALPATSIFTIDKESGKFVAVHNMFDVGKVYAAAAR